MKKVMQHLAAITFSTLLMVAGPLYASGDHAHGHDNDMSHTNDSMTSMSEGMGEMFLVKQQIDGYDVTFHVMKAKSGNEMGGSHDFMIKVEKGGKVVTDIVMNTKVVHPNGQAESKAAMKMGDWMMAGYDLGHAGKHQMMILFKTADGEKHKGGVYYPSK